MILLPCIFFRDQAGFPSLKSLLSYGFLIINKGNEKNLNFASRNSFFEDRLIEKEHTTQRPCHLWQNTKASLSLFR